MSRRSGSADISDSGDDPGSIVLHCLQLSAAGEISRAFITENITGGGQPRKPGMPPPLKTALWRILAARALSPGPIQSVVAGVPQQVAVCNCWHAAVTQRAFTQPNMKK